MPQGTRPVTKGLVVILVAACALLGAAARAAPAGAATPCWKTLLNDWYDGRIDNTYPLHCYTETLAHLPPDVQTYSSARDDILRALQSAKASIKKEGKSPAPNVLVVPPKSGGPSGGTTTTGGETTTATTTTTPTTTLPGRDSGKGLTHLVDKLNPSSPSSLPVPLLVLGGLAILLVAAGAAGLAAKRFGGGKPSP